MQRLVLASRSPRRRELLEQLGLALEVRPSDADETVLPGEDPRAYVLRVAREKARATAGGVVLAADTAVVLEGEVLGKPSDAADARRMLERLSGTTHEVLTGVCVRLTPDVPGPAASRSGGVGSPRGAPAIVELDATVATTVRFARLSSAEIAWYVGTGEPLDKAGAYAIQGAGGAFVLEVRGSVSNVVGLPLAETAALLRRAGFALPWDASPPPAAGGAP